jgi:hypothetical protein
LPLSADELRARLVNLALAKLTALVPGKDQTAKEDKISIMRDCFGTDSRKTFEALPLPELRKGWETLKGWQKEEPPPETAVPEADDDGFDTPEHSTGDLHPEAAPEAVEEDDDQEATGKELSDEEVTTWMLSHLREEAQKQGTVRELEDFIAAQCGPLPRGQALVLDISMREAFLINLAEEFPDLAGTLQEA